VSFGGDEECATSIEDVFGVGITGRDGHKWCSGAEALDYCGRSAARLKAVP
jgi:hypothetical protein